MCASTSRLCLGALALLTSWSCVERTERPSASLKIEPPSVCRGDGFETAVVLDASSSSPRLSLVPAAPDDGESLDFDWMLTGDDHEIVAGGLDEPIIELTMAGERPLGVHLVVRNEVGGELSTQRSVAVDVDCAAGPIP